jgi:hypothetical protein
MGIKAPAIARAARSRVAALLATAADVVAVSGFTLAGATPAAVPQPRLTQGGYVTWELEALLRDTFGRLQPSLEIATSDFDCAGRNCAPLSRYNPYVYLFANAAHSTFRLVSRKAGFASFGLATPIRINGRYVACDAAAKTFVVRYANTFGEFGCMRPL